MMTLMSIIIFITFSSLIATATEELPDFKKWKVYKSISCIRDNGEPAKFKMESWQKEKYIIALVTAPNGETWSMFFNLDSSTAQYYLGKDLVDESIFMNRLEFVFNGEDFGLLESINLGGESPFCKTTP